MEKISHKLARSHVLALIAVFVLTMLLSASAQAEPIENENSAPGDVVITGILDGTLTGGTPKAIELYVEGTVDLSTFTLERATNGNPFGSSTPLSGTFSDTFVYLIGPNTTAGPDAFDAVFGTTGIYANRAYVGSTVSGNGNDAFRILTGGNVIDQVAPISATSTYLDSYMYRNDSTGPDGSWVESNWTIPGNDVLDGLDAAGIRAAVPFGSYMRGPVAGGNLLLVTEVAVTPTFGEMVEIYNPGDTAVDLSNVYLTDATFAGSPSAYYYNIVTGANAGGGTFGDFHAIFPDGASIGAGEYQTVALSGSDNFNTTYGELPTYELFEVGVPDGVPAMREALPGSVNGQGGLSDSGEVVILYQWDGATDLVTDLDYFLWGDKAEAVDKTGITINTSTYLNDTVITSRDIASTGGHAGGNTWQRDDNAEGTETKTDGNGYEGHDETSENLSETFCDSPEPTPNAASICPGPVTDIIINEIHADPDAVNGDANGDEIVDTSQDEFVEIINTSGGPLDISGWTLSDSGAVRHTFPPETIIPDFCSFIVFGGGTPTGDFGNAAAVQTASTGFLGLNNTGDSVSLNDGLTNRATASYGAEGNDNQSITLDPDITGEAFVKHSVATGSNGSLFSPGTLINGNGFSGCPGNYTLIHNIQGEGLASPLVGQTHTVEAIVVGDFQGGNGLSGFYIQEEDADADANPATSEGIWVFDGSTPAVDVNSGDKVQVTGVVTEFSNLTQLGTLSSVSVITSSIPLPTTTTISDLVAANTNLLERYEGMLVTFSETLYLTEYFQLGRFNNAVLAVDNRLQQPTNVTTPGASANALQAQNNLRRLTLDDASSNTFLNIPGLFGRGGNPLSATNLLRGGDSVTGLAGVLDERFGSYRVQPYTSVNFVAQNDRPANPPEVGGRLTIASYNVLNYFTTIDNGSNGARGADSAAELTRQQDKLVQALAAIDADVFGFMEIENNGFGSTSAIQTLTDALNVVVGANTYAIIDPGTSGVGTDAIAVGFIYKPATVTPVGPALTVPNGAFQGAFDNFNRKPLAQTFAENSTNERFTAIVNHFKSKGSLTGLPQDQDQGDGQGNNNYTRNLASQDLLSWIATDPTGSNDPDFLIMGDLNSYAMEDPITTLKDAGYTNLIEDFNGIDAYSYVFNGQFGYLDHSLSNAFLSPQVTGTGTWHINADEPNVYDYNDDITDPGENPSNPPLNKPDLYVENVYRTSDHDPVIVGLNLDTLNFSSLPGYTPAWHSFDGLWLGDVWDVEDGVAPLGNSWQPNATVGLRVNVQIRDPNAWLACWIDWDMDNAFNPDELVIDQLVDNGDHDIYFTVPSDADVGSGTAATLNTRCRLYPTPPVPRGGGSAASPDGGAVGGEVEDYGFQVSPTAVSLQDIGVQQANMPVWLLVLLVSLGLMVSIVVLKRNGRHSVH